MKEFGGNIETIIDLFKFKKVTTDHLVDQIEEYFELNVQKGIDLLITIEHHPEESDKVKFELVIGELYILLNVLSHVDLAMFIQTMSIKN